MTALVGTEVRVEAPRPSRAFYDGIVVAANPTRIIVKHNTTGALEHVDRETGRVMRFDRQRGWIATGWTLHPADVEAMKKADEDDRTQAVERSDNLPGLQGEGADRGD